MRRATFAILLLLPLTACGGGTAGPTAPSAPPPAPAPSPTPAPTPSPAPAPSPAPTPTPPPGPVVLRAASIRGVNGHSAAGTAEIVRAGSTYTLELRSDFRIDMGSVDIYLTRQPGGFTSADLRVAPLGATSGAQSYPLPNDGAVYSYVLLWCRPFTIPIGLGDLQ